MNAWEYQQLIQRLCKQGFSITESIRLILLRNRYVPAASDMPLAYRRLEFARWLVAQGRISDQIH